MNAVDRDKCFGRRLARTGAAQLVVTRWTHRVPTTNERVLAWRWRAQEPGMGRKVIEDCPQPDARCIDPRDVVQAMPPRDREHPATGIAGGTLPPAATAAAPAPPAGSPNAAPGSDAEPGDYSTFADWEAFWRGDAPMPTYPPF